MFIFTFIAKLIFIALSGLSLRYNTEEREFYNDVLVLVQNKKYSQLADVKGWTELLFNVPRNLLELCFILLVLIPTFFSWQFVFVPLYLAAIVLIYRNRPASLFNRNSVFYLNLARLLFILLTFIL